MTQNQFYKQFMSNLWDLWMFIALSPDPVYSKQLLGQWFSVLEPRIIMGVS